MTPRERHLKKRYGITVRTYNTMLKDQQGVCGVCGKPPKSRRLHVDHDHRLRASTKEWAVRGLLCFRCNRGVISNNTLDTLRKAVAYLEKYGYEKEEG